MYEWDESDDLDDDWFYESVKRYNTLQMFHLYNTPDHVIQLDEYTLCIACKNQKCDNTELLELRLPAKLTMPVEDGNRSKDNDFKIVSGLFTENTVLQIGVLKEEKKLITTQKNKKGLQIYNLHCAENQKDELTGEALDTPMFAINEAEKNIICSQCTHKELVMLDLATKEKIRSIRHPFCELNILEGNDQCFYGALQCRFIDSNVFSLLDSAHGGVAVIDLRTQNTFSILRMNNPKNTDEIWIASECDFKTPSNYCGILSDKGNICIFDLRNKNHCISNKIFKFPAVNFNKLKLKLTNIDRFSVSGSDSNVYVYNIRENEFELAFIHNGHCQKRDSQVDDGVVNDHIWLPSVGDNFLISICSNRSLNCWEYNEFT